MVKKGGVMKKIWIITLLAVATAFSCAKINEQETVEPEEKPAAEKTEGRIVFNIQVNQAEGQTKAVKTGWETGDVVYVFFNNVTISDTPKYATLTRTASGWDAAFSDGWDGTGLEESGATMSAVYFPFRLGAYSGYTPIPLQVSKDGSSYTFKAFDVFQGSDRNYGYTTRNIFTYYLKAEQAAYTLTSTSDVTTLSGTLDMTIPDGFVQFYIAADGDRYNENDRYRLAVQKVKPASCYTLGQDGVFFQKERAYGEPMAGCKYGEGILFSGIIDESAWSSVEERRFLLFDTQGPALTRTFTKSLSSHSAVKLPNTGWVRAASEPEKVDLLGDGSLYFADRNVGADDVDDFGLYFQYGEIIPWSQDPLWCFKEDPNIVGNFWCTDDGSHLFKYNASCTLDSYDDPATVWLGPGWKTKGDYNSNTWSDGWVYPVDGGNKTRSITGAGGVIYLPAAGYWDGTTFHSDEGRYMGDWDATASNRWGDHSWVCRQLHFAETGDADYSSDGRYIFIPVRAVSTVAPEYKNLSALATANCYIVSAAGKYKLKATVKGNGYADLAGISKDTDPATIASAELVWATFNTTVAPAAGELIKDISYADGYVYFSTGDTYKEGNALVAIKDGSGNILWSWHIWFHNYDESYLTGANSVQMMNRNLGALSTSVGSPLSYGMYYQWGRKDPFVGPGSGTTLAAVQGTEKSVQVGKVNVATSIQRPVSYYVEVNGSSRWTNGDHWCSDDSKMTFWSSSGKTIFDPCPPGWRMPSSSEITGMGEQYFTSSRGFPASGYFGTEGAYYNPGNGTIWAATVDGACAKIQVLQDDQTIWSRSPDMGFNVRCVRE